MPEIKTSKRHGRGVFATRRYEPGETIITDPIVELTNEERLLLLETRLKSYYFYWESKNDAAIVFGKTSMMNHSDQPNATFYPNHSERIMIVQAVVSIEQGDEITINYHTF